MSANQHRVRVSELFEWHDGTFRVEYHVQLQSRVIVAVPQAADIANPKPGVAVVAERPRFQVIDPGREQPFNKY